MQRKIVCFLACEVFDTFWPVVRHILVQQALWLFKYISFIKIHHTEPMLWPYKVSPQSTFFSGQMFVPFYQVPKKLGPWNFVGQPITESIKVKKMKFLF